MKANRKQNGVTLTASETNRKQTYNVTYRANRKQTEEITYRTVLNALVQDMKLTLNNVG